MPSPDHQGQEAACAAVDKIARAIADEKVGRHFWPLLSTAARLEFRRQATAVLRVQAEGDEDE